MSNSWVNRNWMKFHKDFKPIILWHFELQRTASMNQPPASCRSTTAENCKIRLLEFRDFHYLSPYWSEILSEEHLLFVILQICLVWIPEIVMDRLTCRFHITFLGWRYHTKIRMTSPVQIRSQILLLFPFIRQITPST